jgi:membrane fusion protein, multidrug efflux system
MRRIVIPLTLIALVIAGLLVWRNLGADSAAGGGPAAGGGGGGPPGGMMLPVEAVTVKPEPLGRGLSTVGTLRADEAIVVRPEIAGRVVKIHFTEGQRVKAGAPLFSLDSSVQRAALREAQATLENARRTSTRSEELARGDLISRSELENAQAQLSVAEARVSSARAQLQKTSLVAPFDGVVGLREVSVGAYVNFGQALVNLVRLDPMEVDFSLPESDLGLVKAGQPITVTVDALRGETFKGEVTAIDPMMDINSRSARLRAQIDNDDYKLRPGLFARIVLGTGSNETALLVPEQALLQQGETRFVYIIVDGKAKRAEVKTGQRVPGKLEIVSGLKPGDQVITAGQGKPMMHEGMPVVVLPSGGGQPGGAPGGAPAAGAAGGKPGAGAPAASGQPEAGQPAGGQPADDRSGKAPPPGEAAQPQGAAAAAKPAESGGDGTRKD